VPPSRRVRRSWREAAGRILGSWRVAVAEGSMLPTIAPGDWLLVDPTTRTWPRRGSVVVVREPDTAVLSLKRVVAGPGDTVPFAEGWLRLADDEAWLGADASVETAAAAGFGAPRDSRRYGPVPLDLLVARAWFRYVPWHRLGRLRRRQAVPNRGPVGPGRPAAPRLRR